MLIPRGNGECRRRDALSAGLQGEHALDVPAHRHQVPLALDVLESPQQTLAIAHYRFDDAVEDG